MKVILIFNKKNGEPTRLMLEVPDKKAAKKVKALINARRCPEAMTSVIKNGRCIKELAEKDLAQVDSELILSDSNAYWSLT